MEIKSNQKEEHLLKFTEPLDLTILKRKLKYEPKRSYDYIVLTPCSKLYKEIKK